MCLKIWLFTWLPSWRSKAQPTSNMRIKLMCSEKKNTNNGLETWRADHASPLNWLNDRSPVCRQVDVGPAVNFQALIGCCACWVLRNTWPQCILTEVRARPSGTRLSILSSYSALWIIGLPSQHIQREAFCQYPAVLETPIRPVPTTHISNYHRPPQVAVYSDAQGVY